MTDKNSHLQTTVSKNRGLGSKNPGTSHWWLQKVTSVALLPLTIWFVVISVASFVGKDYQHIYAWMQNPVNGTLMIILFAIMFYHLALGIQVIIEDYVHGFMHNVAMWVVNALSVVIGITVVGAVIKIMMGA